MQDINRGTPQNVLYGTSRAGFTASSGPARDALWGNSNSFGPTNTISRGGMVDYGNSNATPGTFTVEPSFGNGMGQGQFGDIFALIMQQIQDAQAAALASQTVPVTTTEAVTPKGKKIALEQQSNPTSRYGAIPIILGTIDMTPYVSADPWMSFRVGDNKNDFYVGYAFGYGPLDVTDIKVGDIPIDDLDGSAEPGRPSIEYQLVETADDTPQDLLVYDTATTMVNKTMGYNEKIVQVVPQDADLILIAVQFPSGLFKVQTSTHIEYEYDDEDPPNVIGEHEVTVTERVSNSVSFVVEHRTAYSEEDWVVATNNWTINKEIGEALLVSYELDLDEEQIGQREVRLKRKTVVGDGVEAVDECIWYLVSGILTDRAPYPIAPKGADGGDVTVSGLYLKCSAETQQQVQLEPVTATVSSLIPVFREDLGLKQATYAINDRPDDLIMDSSGNENHAVVDMGSGGTWVTIGITPRLRFNGTSTIAAPVALDPLTLTSYKMEGYYTPRGPLGNIPVPDSQILFYANDLGVVRYKPDAQTITATIGGDVELSVSISGMVLDTLRVALEAEVDGSDLDVTLTVYDALNDVVGTDSDSKALAELEAIEEVLIGGDGSNNQGYFLGIIRDVTFEIDGALFAEYAIDDDTTRYPTDGSIRDTSGYGRVGRLSLGGGTWTDDFPARLNFNNSASFELPFPILNPDTNTLKFQGWIKTNRGNSGKNRTARNPILFQPDVFHFCHNPKTKALEVTIGSGNRADVRTPDKLFVDGTVYRFELFLSCAPAGGGEVDVTATVNLYDEDGELLATDESPTRTLDNFDFENIIVGHNSASRLYFDGQLWDLEFYVDSVLHGRYPIDDSATQFTPEVIVADTSGYENHGQLALGTSGVWSEEEPVRLNFANTASITLPFNEFLVNTETENLTIRGYFRPTRYASPKKSQKQRNPLIYQKDLITVYHEPKRKRMEVGVGRGANEIKTAKDLITDGEIYKFELSMDCTLDEDTDVELDMTLKIWDESNTLISTTNETETIDVSKTGTLYIGYNERYGVYFDGQIWDVEFEVDGEVIAEYPINDRPSEKGSKKTEIEDSSGQKNHGRLFPFGEGAPEWSLTEPYRLLFNNNAWIRVPIGFDTNDSLGATVEGNFINLDDAAENPLFIADFGGRLFIDGADLVYEYESDSVRIENLIALDTEYRFAWSLTAYKDDPEPYARINIRLLNSNWEELGSEFLDIPTPTEEDALRTLVFRLATDNVSAFRGRIWDAHVSVQNPHFENNPITSSNPAYECLYLMRSPSFNPKPVPDSMINLQAFYDWATWCTELELRFNAIIDQKVVLWNLIQDVAKAGRAKIVKKDGLYAPAVDMSVSVTGKVPVQYFTRFNSTGFKYRNTKKPKLHALRVNYLDPLNKYQQAQVTVYNDGYSAENATKYEEVDYYGCTRKLLAQRYGRFVIADRELRSKEYELLTDWEGLVCGVGDLVHVSHDAALIGSASGRIISKVVEEGLITKIIVDKGCSFEDGKDYSVIMRNQWLQPTGSFWLENPGAGLYFELTLDNPVAEWEMELVNEGNIFQFGERNSVSKLMFVKMIDRLPDHMARLQLFEYSEDVYRFEQDYDEGIPAHTSLAKIASQYRYVPPVPVIDTTFVSGLVITVTLEAVSADDAKYLMIAYREEGTEDWLTVSVVNTGSPVSKQLTQGIAAATTYEIRARSISHASVGSDWCDVVTREVP